MPAGKLKPPLESTELICKALQDEENDGSKGILDHQFVVAAYIITWVIQLGYLAWLGLKWRAQKRRADRSGRNLRVSLLHPHTYLFYLSIDLEVSAQD